MISYNFITNKILTSKCDNDIVSARSRKYKFMKTHRLCASIIAIAVVIIIIGVCLLPILSIIVVIIHIAQRRRCVFFLLPFLSLLLVLSDRSATVVAFCRCAFSSLSVCRRNIHTRYFLISFRLPRLHR